MIHNIVSAVQQKMYFIYN